MRPSVFSRFVLQGRDSTRPPPPYNAGSGESTATFGGSQSHEDHRCHGRNAGAGPYAAEDYHQDFIAHHPDYPYVVVNDLPKLRALKGEFPELLKTKK
jgi:hypothetical protein